MDTLFNEPHSLAIRIWHWIFFVVVASTLVTVLLASTLFKTRNTVGVVQDRLQQKGVTVNTNQAQAVAHDFNDRLWNVHKIIGYVICGLLLCRIIIELAQPREEKFRVKLKRVIGFKPNSLLETDDKRHYLWVKTSYLLFYFLILVMALTGLGLAFEDNPLLKEWHIPIKKLHSLVQYFIYGFILIHLVGVIRADATRSKGLVSGMIHGEKRL